MIFVETQGKLTPKSGFNLMTIGYANVQKRFPISRESFRGKIISEVLEEYGRIIREHYREHNGSLPMLGSILGYRVKIMRKTCRFLPNGEFKKFLKIPIWEEDNRPLFERIKSKLQFVDYGVLAEKLNFKDASKLKNALELMSGCENLEMWIGKGFYREGKQAVELYVDLTEVLFNEKEEASQEIKNFRNLRRRCEKFSSVVYVLTQKSCEELKQRFLGGEYAYIHHLKEIGIDRGVFCGKSKQQVLEIYQEIIASCYQRNGGRLEFWGEIKGYETQCYQARCVFDVSGNLLEEIPR